MNRSGFAGHQVGDRRVDQALLRDSRFPDELAGFHPELEVPRAPGGDLDHGAGQRLPNRFLEQLLGLVAGSAEDL